MTAAALASAVAAAALFIGSGVVVSLAVRRTFFAAWRGSTAVVAVALTGTCWALVLGHLLGAFGLLRALPLLVSAVVSAAGVHVACRHLEVQASPASPEVGGTSPARIGQDPLLVATVLLVLFVGALWAARTAITVRRGIYDPDSLGYHLPFTTTFAQTGYADPTRFRYPTSPVEFFPANDELLSGIALVLTKSVVFVAVKNLLFGGLVLVAAHAIGKVFGAGLLAVSGTAIVLGLPAVAFSQPGEGMNDTLPVFALLGGLAALAAARDGPAPYVLALTAAGVAYGSKYTTVVPAIGLGILALCLLRARLPVHRLRVAVAGVLASLAVGGSWYLRNAVTYGSPVPPARIALGPFALRHIATEGAQDSYSVAWYLVRGRALAQLWHGMGLGLSPLFPLVVLAVLFGTLAALRSSGGFRRGLGVLALVSGLAYLTLPGSAYGTRGNPGPVFVINLHYAFPLLVLGAVAAAVALGPRRHAWVVPAAGAVMVATGIRPGQRVRVWAPEIGGTRFALLVGAAAAGAFVAWMSTRPRLVRWVRPSAAATGAIAAVGLLMVAGQYPRLVETDAVQRWAAEAAPTRIGGWVPEGLLYGPGARNRVVTLTRDRSPDGGPVAIDTCPGWMQALRDGRFPFTAVVTTSQWQGWLDADPAFELVARNDVRSFYPVSVYRVREPPDPNCPRVR